MIFLQLGEVSVTFLPTSPVLYFSSLFASFLLLFATPLPPSPLHFPFSSLFHFPLISPSLRYSTFLSFPFLFVILLSFHFPFSSLFHFFYLFLLSSLFHFPPFSPFLCLIVFPMFLLFTLPPPPSFAYSFLWFSFLSSTNYLSCLSFICMLTPFCSSHLFPFFYLKKKKNRPFVSPPLSYSLYCLSSHS